MPRILSIHGKVIAADFRPDTPLVEVKSEILYCDRLVCLLRFTLYYRGEAVQTGHVTAQTPTA